MSDNRDFIYTIPQRVLLDLSLHLTDLRVYALVRSFIDTTKDAYPSNGWLAKKLGVEKRTIQASIEKHIKKGHITRTFDENGRRHLNIGRPVPEDVVGYPEDDLQITPPRSTDHPPHDLQITQLDQRSITSKNINNICANKNFLEEAFNKLWEYYPNKKGKQIAYKKFLQIARGKPGEEVENLTKAIWVGIIGMVQEHQWLKEFNEAENAKEFIPEYPHGSTWFAQERWTDERETDPKQFLEKMKAKQRKRKTI